ncbi:hypothetical protein JW992_13680, partial [candidate division KSB1 bacterium]|nr:hypothetical protein [candidate division KSB1 bacterium]
MRTILIFHANLNYAYLTPDRYEFVIRQAYEMIIDTFREHFPDCSYVFEASGYTLDEIAARTPDVLGKLRRAIADGQCEFMGSPYAHPMLPNFPAKDGSLSIGFSNQSYQRHLQLAPTSFWNPECGWNTHVPHQVLENGYQNLIGDFEAYSRSLGADGKPLRPEIYAAEHSDEPAFYNFGFRYDLPGTELAIHFPFQHLSGVESTPLRVFLRSDRIAQFGVRYFMGMPGYTLDKYRQLIETYSSQPKGEPEGALIVYADDAEYIGTNGWFRLKYQNQPDRVFEATPDSRQKLIDLVNVCREQGELTTFQHACRALPALEQELNFDDDSAWHGARASTWAKTPMARLLRPWQDSVRQKLETRHSESADLERAWFHLTNSYNSDGQWPPTLPDAPHIIHPFNYRYCFENLLKAELLAGGIDRSRLETDPWRTLQEILGPQAERIETKARQLSESREAQHYAAA